jgi:hypothetical protein
MKGEQKVNCLPALAPDETVANCVVPDPIDPGDYPGCMVCDGMAYRVVTVEGTQGRRSLALCGVHFTSAASRIAQLQRYVLGRQVGVKIT